MYCSFCRSDKHTIINCPKTWGGQANRRNMRCGFCGSRDHNIEACPKTWRGNALRAWHPYAVEDHYVEDKW